MATTYPVPVVIEAPKSHSLSDFATDIALGNISIIDLTHTLSPDFPALVLPPQFAQTWGFKQENISAYDENGPAWMWNNFSCGEHSGTHFDAPVHWVTGKDHPNNSVDTIKVENFIAPCCVVDASKEVAENCDFVMTIPFLLAWEAQNGRIASGSWLILRTDWCKRISSPADFINMREDGAHTPRPSQEAVEWLIKERNVIGFGCETINTDAGQSHSWPTPYPCHTLMHGANKFGLQCLNNTDQLPPTGAMIIAAPLKMQNGSGSPTRVLALVQR